MTEKLFETWSQDDQSMEERHQRHWQRFIELIVEPDLSRARVLDFGCNQGGFLRKLYHQKPFEAGVGVDVAQASIAVANTRKGHLPLSYLATRDLDCYEDEFDIVVSNAVVYLLPDLGNHARVIKHVLRPGGVYYATHSDYAGDPDYLEMRERINSYSPMEMQEHSLSDIAEAFHGEGFEVSLQRFQAGGFVPIQTRGEGISDVGDRMRAEYTRKFIFRLQPPAA